MFVLQYIMVFTAVFIASGPKIVDISRFFQKDLTYFEVKKIDW